MIGISKITSEIVSAKEIGVAIGGFRAREEEDDAWKAALEAAKAARRSK